MPLSGLDPFAAVLLPLAGTAGGATGLVGDDWVGGVIVVVIDSVGWTCGYLVKVGFIKRLSALGGQTGW